MPNIFEGQQAKLESAATIELVGDVMQILLQSSNDNAVQLNLVARSFRVMADDFEQMANDIADRNKKITKEFEEQARKLELQATELGKIRKSIGESLMNTVIAIRNSLKPNN